VNCDIPAVEEMVRDPVLFFQNCPSSVLVFDEIHQLRDPTRLLKIGADMFPNIKILAAGSSTHAATCVRPFHRGSRREIVKQPKVYAFDTGFVSFVRGWDPLRLDDLGPLWEHLVLETLQGLVSGFTAALLAR
jgi:predicted AAA+ superfamily ATPase